MSPESRSVGGGGRRRNEADESEQRERERKGSKEAKSGCWEEKKERRGTN